MPRRGDRRLFLLERAMTIPGAYVPSPWGIFRIDGAVARFDDFEQTSVRTFTDAAPPADFLDALRVALEGR